MYEVTPQFMLKSDNSHTIGCQVLSASDSNNSSGKDDKLQPQKTLNELKGHISGSVQFVQKADNLDFKPLSRICSMAYAWASFHVPFVFTKLYYTMAPLTVARDDIIKLLGMNLCQSIYTIVLHVAQYTDSSLRTPLLHLIMAKDHQHISKKY